MSILIRWHRQILNTNGMMSKKLCNFFFETQVPLNRCGILYVLDLIVIYANCINSFDFCDFFAFSHTEMVNQDHFQGEFFGVCLPVCTMSCSRKIMKITFIHKMQEY